VKNRELHIILPEELHEKLSNLKKKKRKSWTSLIEPAVSKYYENEFNETVICLNIRKSLRDNLQGIAESCNMGLEKMCIGVLSRYVENVRDGLGEKE